jgi:hypothetical protein
LESADLGKVDSVSEYRTSFKDFPLPSGHIRPKRPHDLPGLLYDHLITHQEPAFCGHPQIVQYLGDNVKKIGNSKDGIKIRIPIGQERKI